MLRRRGQRNLTALINEPDIKAKLVEKGFEIVGNTPEQFEKFRLPNWHAGRTSSKSARSRSNKLPPQIVPLQFPCARPSAAAVGGSPLPYKTLIMKIKNRKDFWAGVTFAIFGLFFAGAGSQYTFSSAARMGPGTFQPCPASGWC
jgi:hypothetical protein